jgi:hypothetical protein
MIILRGKAAASYHRRCGALSLDEFAALHGLTRTCLLFRLGRGFVTGVVRDSITRRWWFYPGAELVPFPRMHRPSSDTKHTSSGAAHVERRPRTPSVFRRAAPAPAKQVLTLVAPTGNPWLDMLPVEVQP